MLSRRRRCRRARIAPSWGAALWLTLAALGSTLPAVAQDELTLPELELAYRSSLDEYRAAFQALEVLEMRFSRASMAFDSARAEGDRGAQQRALAVTYQLGPEVRQQERRVGEKAQELRAARNRLLEARAQRLAELLAQAEQSRDPVERQELAILVQDMSYRIAELRAQEDPEVALEPEQDITIEPRHGPEDIRRLADHLDWRGDQYVELLSEIDRQLEGLRRDLRLMRQSQDFVAGVERFGDARLPVGPPGARPDRTPDPAQPPGAVALPGSEERPLTLEERIQILVVTREEVFRRIDGIRVKAESFRRQIRLDMADVRSLFARGAV
jgi:DNA repair exonuclease SbcCD ATPase subunit